MRPRLVIVGSGLGGCCLAASTLERFDVTVIEQGAMPDGGAFDIVDAGLPAVTDPHVGFGFGGTTALWHNGLIEISESVFRRSWPFDKSALDPFYEEAVPLLSKGATQDRLRQSAADLASRHAAMGIHATHKSGLYYPTWPINVWTTLRLEGRVKAIAARATTLKIDANGRCTGVQTSAGLVEADVVALAAGGLGTPALLQRTAATYPFAGAGQVGCHYEDHPMTFVGELQLTVPLYRLWNFSVRGTSGNMRLPLVIERDGLEISFQLRPSATVSGSSRRQRVDTVLNDLRQSPFNPLTYLRLLLQPDDILDILSFKLGWHLPTSHYTILMVAEMPTRPERDVWSDTRSGATPTVQRRWVLTDEYLQLLQGSIEELIRSLGPLVTRARVFEGWGKTLRSAAHHSGTARLSNSPDAGVCDPNAKVHGLANVFVCDGSAIPASGIANTGLTIAALALRLGQHLCGPYADSSPRAT
jgi:choline dehydrogenase-like flavoprotein